MIAEALAWLLTPCPPYVRRLGLLAESVAIDARHRRCHAAWAPHLARTRAAVLDAIRRTSRRRTVLVLGSGALLDLPLAELAGAFRAVVLVDVVHPWRSRLASRRFANVTRITDDVTGVLEAVSNGDLASPSPYHRIDSPEVDLVVSLNLLSQLPVIPVRRLDGRVAAAPLTAMAQDLVRSHLADLDRSQASTLLVSDVERVSVDGGGRVVERESLIADLPEPAHDHEWWWDIAPAPEADPETSERRRVIARFVPGAFGAENL